MNTQEYVEEYAKAHKSNFRKFFVTQLIIEIILVAVFVFSIIKFMNNSLYLNICIVVFVVLLEAAFFLNIKRVFGSFKRFAKSSSINKRYNDALKSFEANNDKALFDEKLNELELMIKEQEKN